MESFHFPQSKKIFMPLSLFPKSIQRLFYLASFLHLALFGKSYGTNPFITIYKSNGDSCRLAPYITTHFDNVFGDTLGYGKDPDTSDKLYPKDFYPNDISKRPEFNNYHQMNTVGTAISIATGSDTLKFDMDTDRLLRGSNNVADAIDIFAWLYRKEVKSSPLKYGTNPGYLDILNYGYYDPSVLFYLKESCPNTQILNNVRIGNPGSGYFGMATLFFPPYWKRNRSDGKKYPIYLHGNGYGVANTNELYQQKNIYDAELAAAAFHLLKPDSGMIVVYINNGGLESMGINQSLLDNIKSFFKNSIGSFGGDANRVIVSGESRGGSEAGIWGTLSDGINVRTILSGVAPIKIGSGSDFSLSTLPLLSAMNKVLGSKNAWRIDYAGISQTEKAQSMARVLTGSSNLDKADSKSLYGYFERANVDSLNKKFIHFAYGSHDGFFHLGYFLQFDSMLSARKIRHSTQIGYSMGHNTPNSDDYFQAEWKKINSSSAPYPDSKRKFMVQTDLLPNQDPSPPSVIWIDTTTIRIIDSIRPNYFSDGASHNPSELGFSAVIPYRIIKAKPFEIILTGSKGKSWSLWVREERTLNCHREGSRSAEAIGCRPSAAQPQPTRRACRKRCIEGDLR